MYIVSMHPDFICIWQVSFCKVLVLSSNTPRMDECEVIEVEEAITSQGEFCSTSVTLQPLIDTP